MAKDLFKFVMEADEVEDQLQPFDAGSEVADNTTSSQPENNFSDPPQGNDDQGFNDPPEMSSDSGEGDLSYNGNDDVTDGLNVDEGDGNNEVADNNKEDEKLSKKANDILNQKLYQQMTDRNSEVDEIINNLQTIIPVLPYDIAKSNDDHIMRLKSALLKGQHYVINDFVESGYGENLLFFQKLDALYVLLLNSIDTNLKKVSDNS